MLLQGLTDEQAKAYRAVLSGTPGGLVLVFGLAGTGKTNVLARIIGKSCIYSFVSQTYTDLVL